MHCRYDMIIWDFNGTLLDDVQAALCSVNDILRIRDREEISLETYREYTDTPIIKFYEHLFDMNTTSFDQLSHEFHEGYRRHEHLTSLSCGALELIDKSAYLGVRHVICTASEESKVKEQLEALSISDRFEHVIAASDRTAGSKIEGAVEFMKKTGAAPERTLFIGDCVHDYQTACAIGAQCALLSSGHQSKSALLTCKAIIIDTLSELCPFIFNNGGR